MPVPKRLVGLMRRPSHLDASSSTRPDRHRTRPVSIQRRPTDAALRAVLPADQRWMVSAYGD